MANYIVLAIIAVLSGYVEQQIYRHGYRDNGPHWWKLNPRYHLPLFGIWFAVCWLAGYWWLTPAFCVLEDLSYFRFHPSDELDASDWVTFGMGGVGWPGKFFIPTTYLIGIGLTVILYLIGGR